MRLLVFALLSLLLVTSASAQLATDKGWIFSKQDAGIKVYTRKLPGATFSEVRVVTTMNLPAKQLRNALADDTALKDWVYNCAAAHVIKRQDANNYHIYSETELPYPMSNREMVGQVKRWQDPITKIYYARTLACTGVIPVTAGKVRIYSYESLWKLTAISANTVEVDYRIRSNPGGDLPAWVVDMFMTTGPLESVKKLKSVAMRDKYK